MGFFGQLPHTGLPQCFMLLNKPPGYRPLPFTRCVGTPNQQNVVLASHNRIHCDKNRRVRCIGPRLAVAAQHLPLFLQSCI